MSRPDDIGSTGRGPFDPADYLGRGLSSVIRRQRSRAGPYSAPAETAPSTRESDFVEPVPDELAGLPVVGLIGRGGVGFVYRVVDPKFERDLAVKVLSRRYAGDPEMVQRFCEEAKICGQLQHPGVVPIHDCDRLEDGRPFFTMKVVEGETLAEVLRSRTDSASARQPCLEVLSRVCQTVAYVHARGVVHGDLKPSNVMVGAFGEVQVMDWGFARVVDPERTQPRPGGGGVGPGSDGSSLHVLGTPAYMAPEQARGDMAAITARTDVFGLGAILCEILTGAPPYQGESRSEVYLRATRGWQDDVRSRLDVCGADGALIDLARRCLELEPGQRPEDAGSVQGEIAAYLESVEERAHRLELRAARAEARAAQERRSRRLATALASVVVVAVVTVTAIGIWMQSERSSREAETHRLIVAAMERARLLGSQARGRSPGTVLGWREAVASAQQAVQLAAVRDASADDSARAADLLAQLERDRSAAERDRDLLEWLEEVRPHYTDDRGSSGVSEAYRRGFEKFGLPFDPSAIDRFAARVGESAVAANLCAALDDWAYAARRQDDPIWRDLVAAARAADADPMRDRMRAALLEGDLGALEEIGDSGTFGAAAPATVNLLAKTLFQSGRKDTAIGVLRRACLDHPDDFWMQHDLAVFLRDRLEPPWSEILGLCRAAAGLRPNDAHALTDLAHALMTVQELDGAEAVLRQALDVRPDYSRALRFSGLVQRRRGDIAGSWTWFERAAALPLNKDSALAACDAALACVYLGRLDQAASHALDAIAVQPERGSGYLHAGFVAFFAGKFDQATAYYAEGLRWSPDSSNAWMRRARAHLRMGELGEADAAIARAAETALPAGRSQVSSFRSVVDALLEVSRTDTVAMPVFVDPLFVETGLRRIWRAHLSFLRGDPVAAARAHERLAESDPELFRSWRHRRWAALALVAASWEARRSEEANRWRERARSWLEQQLDVWRTSQRAGNRSPADTLLGIRLVQNDPALAPIRFDAPEGRLAESERGPWSGFFAECERFADSLLRD